MPDRDIQLLQQRILRLQEEGKHRETIEACTHLINQAGKCALYSTVMGAHAACATAFHAIGDLESAFRHMEEHAKLCESYGTDAEQLDSYSILFLLYDYSQDFDKMKTTLEDAINLGKKLRRYDIVSTSYIRFSQVCNQEGNYIEALDWAQMGLEMADLHEPAAEILTWRAFLNRAKAFLGLEQWEEAERLLDNLVASPILNTYNNEKAQIYALQGRYFIARNRLEEASASLLTAKKLVEDEGDLRLLKDIQELRTELCERMGNFAEGFKIQKEYIALLEEIKEGELDKLALRLDVQLGLSKMKKRVNTDFLTGLYNRSYMETNTNFWLKKAAANEESILCMAIDIDNLKGLNDTHGHLFGDEVIQKVARTCSQLIREGDRMGRYGGDEFVLVMPNITLENGKRKAEQLAEAVRALEIKKDGKLIPVSVSIGLADNDNGTIQEFHEIFHLADTALYEAKRSGKNRAVHYSHTTPNSHKMVPAP
ncbi:diguanylate cyclase [Sporosarcina sp. 179-K 3D1 HS]|uniref:diguanylate cyclase n=1 Tax=Sporosarcina sp. 179-K 3D1 HS TaxID=3232169 RepID=UPI00399F4BB6